MEAKIEELENQSKEAQEERVAIRAQIKADTNLIVGIQGTIKEYLKTINAIANAAVLITFESTSFIDYMCYVLLLLTLISRT